MLTHPFHIRLYAETMLADPLSIHASNTQGKMSHQSPVTIYDPVHDSIASEVKARLGEYSQKVQIDVFVGTYNLNGKPPSEETLEPWLCFDKGTTP